MGAIIQARIANRTRPPVPLTTHLGFLLFLALSTTTTAFAQDVLPPPPNQAKADAIRSQSNIVLIRVVVRDSRGKAVTGLNKNDFEILDDKKRQAISYFSAESVSPAVPAVPAPGLETAASERTAPGQPRRFTALFFDDYHMEFGDLVQVREAARRYLKRSLNAGSEVAIVSASGKPLLDFTNDATEIDAALAQLHVDSRFKTGMCPKLPAFFAQKVADDVPPVAGQSQQFNRSEALDQERALRLAEQIASAQRCPVSQDAVAGGEDMQSRARNMVFENKLGVQETLIALGSLVQRMSGMPGQRTIATVSDGLFDRGLEYRMDEVVDRAMRTGVVINTLDSLGLWVGSAGGDAHQMRFQYTPEVQLAVNQMNDDSKQIESGPLLELAEATGGIFVQNTNDMGAGLDRVSELNAPSYLLGFSPRDLKRDGRFHTLQVKLTTSSRFTVEARRGYYAPQKPKAGRKARFERMEAVAFTQEDLDGFPLKLVMKAGKASSNGRTLDVAVDVGMAQATFLKDGGENVDEADVLVFVFKNGQYLESRQQTVKLRLSDQDLERLRRSGGEADVQFTLQPGDYLVRAVMADSNSEQLGTVSKDVTIPQTR